MPLDCSKRCVCAGTLASLAVLCLFSGLFLQLGDFNGGEAVADAARDGLNLVIPGATIGVGALLGAGAITATGSQAKHKTINWALLLLMVGGALFTLFSSNMGINLSCISVATVGVSMAFVGAGFIYLSIDDAMTTNEWEKENEWVKGHWISKKEAPKLPAAIGLKNLSKATNQISTQETPELPAAKQTNGSKNLSKATNQISTQETPVEEARPVAQPAKEDGTVFTIGEGHFHSGRRGKVVGKHANGGILFEYVSAKNRITTNVGEKYIPEARRESVFAAADKIEHVKKMENPKHFTKSKLLKPTESVVDLLKNLRTPTKKLRTPTKNERAQKMMDDGNLTAKELTKVRRRLANRLTKMMTL